MVVIGFFRDLITNLAGLVQLVSVPLIELGVTISPFRDYSIMQLFSGLLILTLSTLLVIHLVRLFIGG